MKLEFRLLGPVEATADSVPLDLGGPKQRALLAQLLLRANEVVPRDRLIDELWGDAPPPTARDTVKVYVGRLRKVLEQNGAPKHLVTRGGGYLVEVQPDQLDLHRFQRLVANGSAALEDGDAETAASVLREALALWRGPPLADISEAAFAQAERTRLEDLRLAAIEERIDADLVLGRASALVPELRQLTREHPYRERFQQQLMLALYSAGRQAEALAAYQDARTMLADLGIEPSNALRNLEKSILTHDSALEIGRRRTAGVRAAPARRRRRLFIVCAAVVVAAAAAAAVVLVTRADPALHIYPNSVAIIDPASNKLVGAIPVGTAPAQVVAADGRVWVGNSGDATVTSIDPDGRTAGPTIPVGATPVALAAGADAVWVVTGAQSGGSRLALVRIDPRFAAVSRRVTLGQASPGTPRQPLAFGSSTIWSPGRLAGLLVRREPTTLVARGAVELDGDASAVAADSDAVWVTTYNNRLLRIDPVTNGVIEDIPTGGRPLDVAVGAHAVWIASWSDDVVIRYDLLTGAATPIRVGDGPAAVSIGFGSVWVACSGDGTVWRIDPATRSAVAHWELGVSPEDIAAGEGAVWIAAYSELPP